MAKHIFVTGGVVSSLGKGITAASLGHLLKARGYQVTMQKMDPYLNVDPGTMSPFQHGEVFVTEDGHEGDLDLGHYERFIDENLTRESNFTQGSIYQSLIARERRGDYLGGTPVQEGAAVRRRAVRSRDAGALYSRSARGEDEAHAAFGEGAALHRRAARLHRVPLGPRDRGRRAREDRAVLRRAARGGAGLHRRAVHLRGAAGLARAALRRDGARPVVPRAAFGRLGAPALVLGRGGRLR